MPSHSDPSARKIDPKYPVPTSDVLQWSQQELGMLVHFNMATFIDSDGCNYDPNLVPSINLFNPYLINTDQWAQTIAAFGAKYAVLVAKHNCGFAIWPTKVAFPEAGFVYNYSVANSPTSWFDVVGNFVKSCQAQGIKTGFYYSVVVNNWLNVQNGKVQGNPSPQQANITQELYDKIVLAQLTELWENYGQNGLEEIWFDGGYTDELKPNITSLLNTAQPHAAVFNGFGVSNNPVRWIGSEFGVAPDPTWSTGTTNDGGDPDSPIWCPAECDTTLQENDRWFWGENATLRSLDDMIKVYHQTVGHNCQLMLDLTPDRTGLIPSEYAQLYKQLGDFIQRCYSTPVVQVTNIDGLLAYLTIQPTQTTNDPFTFDRLVIQEDQTYGQRIRSYSIEAYPVGGNEWVHLLSGTSVGNKKIELLPAPMTVYAVRLTVSSTVDTPIIRNFAAHLC